MEIRDFLAREGYSILLKKKEGCFQLGGVNGDDQIGMRFKVLSREGRKLYSE